MKLRGRKAAALPSKGRWRIEPYMDSDNDWCARIYGEDGGLAKSVWAGVRGYGESERQKAIKQAQIWCDKETRIRDARAEAEKARAEGGGVIWYGEPSVKSLQARIQELEQELDI